MARQAAKADSWASDIGDVDADAARKIPVANIYHMLCYAWQFFELTSEVAVDKDHHRGYAELLTKVLNAGCIHLLKQGLL